MGQSSLRGNIKKKKVKELKGDWFNPWWSQDLTSSTPMKILKSQFFLNVDENIDKLNIDYHLY